jgi:isopenicillin-N epimerase
VTDKSLWAHEDGLTFLNHGSFGATPRPVLEHQASLRAEMERDPIRFLVDELEQRLDTVRAFVAPRLGAPAEGLAFVPNPTFAVNSVLASIALSPGDEIVFTSHGYNACNNAVLRRTEQSGAVPVCVELPFPVASAATVTERLVSALTKRTRLLLVDHVTSPTGLVLPVEDIVREAHARGIDVLIDGAHAPGMLPLSIERLGVAWYTGAFHKWLCAPKGASFLYTREDKRGATRPIVTSHGANTTRTDRSRYLVEFDWTGTHDPTAVLSVPAAIEAVEALHPDGIAGVMRDNRELALRGRALLAERLEREPPCPDEMVGALAALSLPAGPADALRLALRRRHRIQVPVFAFRQAPERLVRVSAQRYNALPDYERLARALEIELAAERELERR